MENKFGAKIQNLTFGLSIGDGLTILHFAVIFQLKKTGLPNNIIKKKHLSNNIKNKALLISKHANHQPFIKCFISLYCTVYTWFNFEHQHKGGCCREESFEGRNQSNQIRSHQRWVLSHYLFNVIIKVDSGGGEALRFTPSKPKKRKKISIIIEGVTRNMHASVGLSHLQFCNHIRQIVTVHVANIRGGAQIQKWVMTQ